MCQISHFRWLATIFIKCLNQLEGLSSKDIVHFLTERFNTEYLISTFRVTVVKDRVTRKSKGVAFVQFLYENDAQRCAQEYNGKEVKIRIRTKSNSNSTAWIFKSKFPAIWPNNQVQHCQRQWTQSRIHPEEKVPWKVPLLRMRRNRESFELRLSQQFIRCENTSEAEAETGISCKRGGSRGILKLCN